MTDFELMTIIGHLLIFPEAGTRSFLKDPLIVNVCVTTLVPIWLNGGNGETDADCVTMKSSWTTGYRIDLLVDDRVVVEIKTVEEFSEVHKAQVLTHLRLGQYRIEPAL